MWANFRIACLQEGGWPQYLYAEAIDGELEYG